MEVYPDQLRHLYDSTKNQFEGGMREFARITKFFARFVKLQTQFVADLRDMCAKENEKIDSQPPDGMASSYESWRIFFRRITEVADAHESFATEITMTLVKPMEETPNHLTIQKQPTAEAASDTRKLQGLSKTLEKDKRTALKAISALETATDKYHADIKAKKQPNKSKVDTARKTAYKCAKTYSETIVTVNKKSEKHRKNLIPALQHVQVREESRVTSLQNFLRKYSSIQKSFCTTLKRVADQYGQLASNIVIREDLLEFAQSCISVAGEAPPLFLHPVNYDLPLSVEQLEKDQIFSKLDFSGGKLFGHSLSEVLEYESQLTGKQLEVPQILDTLCESVVSLNGLHTKGIFRISSSSEEREALINQFQKGNYTITVKDPHVPAGVLKFWLRELSEPLFESKKYDECITIGKLPPTSPEIKERIGKVYNTLPKENQAVISRVIKLAVQVVANAAENKMTMGNMGVVLGPCLLRSESEEQDDEAAGAASAMRIMQDAKYAAQFVVYLAESLTGQKFESEHEGSSGVRPSFIGALPIERPVSGESPLFMSKTISGDVKEAKTSTPEPRGEEDPPTPTKEHKSHVEDGSKVAGLAASVGVNIKLGARPPPVSQNHLPSAKPITLTSGAKYPPPGAFRLPIPGPGGAIPPVGPPPIAGPPPPGPPPVAGPPPSTPPPSSASPIPASSSFPVAGNPGGAKKPGHSAFW